MEHLHHRSCGEPAQFVRLSIGKRQAEAPQLSQHDGRCLLVLGQGAQLRPIDPRGQQAAHRGVAGPHASRQQQQLGFR